jgi:hypothetical protein
LDAIRKYDERIKRGLTVDQVNDADLAEYLAQVNITEVRTRYTDNLKAVYESADQKVWAEDRKAIAERMLDSEREKDENETKAWKPKGPEGGGYVVELRGWTFHSSGFDFMVQGVVKNFQNAGLHAEQTGTAPVEKFIPGVADPLKGRISHVCLTLSKMQESPNQNVLDLIAPGKSYLERFIAPAAAVATTDASSTPTDSGGNATTVTGGATAGSGWVPLTGAAPTAAGGAGGGYSTGMYGYDDSGSGSGGNMMQQMMTGPMGGSTSPTPATTTTPDAARAASKLGQKRRTVFVLMFVWRDTAAEAAPTEAAK